MPPFGQQSPAIQAVAIRLLPVLAAKSISSDFVLPIVNNHTGSTLCPLQQSLLVRVFYTSGACIQNDIFQLASYKEAVAGWARTVCNRSETIFARSYVRMQLMMLNYKIKPTFTIFENKLFNTLVLQSLGARTATTLYGAFAKRQMSKWPRYDRALFTSILTSNLYQRIPLVVKSATDGQGMHVWLIKPKTGRLMEAKQYPTDGASLYTDTVRSMSIDPDDARSVSNVTTFLSQHVEHMLKKPPSFHQVRQCRGVLVQRLVPESTAEHRPGDPPPLLVELNTECVLGSLTAGVAKTNWAELRQLEDERRGLFKGVHSERGEPQRAKTPFDRRMNAYYSFFAFEGSRVAPAPHFRKRFEDGPGIGRMGAKGWVPRERHEYTTIMDLVGQHAGELASICQRVASTFGADWFRLVSAALSARSPCEISSSPCEISSSPCEISSSHPLPAMRASPPLQSESSRVSLIWAVPGCPPACRMPS